MKPTLWLTLALCACATTQAAAPAVDIPFRAGVSFVLAVNAPAETVAKGMGIVAGDYELLVRVDAIQGKGHTQTAFYDGTDESGVHRRGKVTRFVRGPDLANGRVQVLGFHSSDPQTVDGGTSLGPSREFVRRVLDKGEAAYAFRMFASSKDIRGTLRTVATDLPFPLLVNGRRVTVRAFKVQGQLELDGNRAPFEMLVLDHPAHPLSLRVAYGARGEGFPFEPRFAREIVQINYHEDRNAVSEALTRDCRVEVPGLYFDFNRDTLKPESRAGLEAIAAALSAAPGRKVRIEGHTDNVGNDAYNDDLSLRRARAVRTALESELGLEIRNVGVFGHGERKPIESNDTISGRARNRRVELVCAP
jgi:outer membrane protein OmpA-like peptidoglycan-associated protein